MDYEEYTNTGSSLQDILKERLEQFKKNPQQYSLEKGKTYNKEWNFAVNCFKERINKDMRKQGKREVTFIAVRQKLVALKEIDDLRWYYKYCLDNGMKFDKNKKRYGFSRIFYAGLKIK